MARTRSARAHQKVLDAALELFANQGIDATSMDAVSEAAGVSKATIYKHWPDKKALCLEALARAHKVDELPEFDSGDLRRDLLAFLEYRPAEEYDEMRRRLMPHFMAYAARNPAFERAWRARVMEPPRERLRQLLERGVKEGALPKDYDLELGMALLLGPMMYRFALGPDVTKLPRDLPRRVLDSFWKANATGGGKREKAKPKRGRG